MKFNKFNFLIHKFCGNYAQKPNIAGVFVKPNETVATDGFRLVEVSAIGEDNQNFKPFILEAKHAETYAKEKGDFEAASVKGKTIKSDFPKYKEIMEQKGKYAEVAVNPKYLKELADFYAHFGKELRICVPVESAKPIFFYAENKETGQKSRAALMPIAGKP